MILEIEYNKENNKIEFYVDKQDLPEKLLTIVNDFIESIICQKDDFIRDFRLSIEIADESITIREQDRVREYMVPGYNSGYLELSFYSYSHDFPIFRMDRDIDAYFEKKYDEE